MAAEVEFETFEGVQHALIERFPLGGAHDNAAIVNCLVLQNEKGGPAVRVRFASPEADALRKRYPALNDLDPPTQPDGAPAAAPSAAAIDYDALAEAMIRAQKRAREAADAAAAAPAEGAKEAGA